MTADYSEAMQDARNSATGIIDRIANRLGNYARSEVVFGQPVTHDGVTVIPVAKIGWGFGGGGGSGTDESGVGDDYGEGGGGGGGVSAKPAGFIEISGGRAEFKPINDWASMWPALLGGAVAFWIALRAIRGLFH